MSNQFFAAKTTRTRKKRNATKAMAAAFFCVSSSLSAQGVRAFSTTANSGVSAFVRTSNSKSRTFIPAARTSLAFSADNKIGSGIGTKNYFWGTPTSLRLASTATDEESSAVTEASCAYDLENKEAGLGNYAPTEFENKIYQWWESAGCFQPDAKQTQEESDANGRKPYVLPMPPPNVTGRLHMGHAIFVALQDVLARFHRMRGRPVLWLPGTDHAGIATQLQVEKQLIAEGTSREEVGREEFLDRVWTYKAEQGGHITRQLRSLGASADWTRERFTMDNDLSEAVSEAFVRLHDKGLVYRGEYMVNWAPLLKTAVSDLEVEYTEEEGKLYFFKYMVEGTDEFLPVATTRPETIMGDTAVCVHPEDERYKDIVGKQAVVPMGNGRTIPIIADEYVDMEFGTGALKITPGHDPNDYAIGKKFDLPIINIMNKDGSLNENSGAYNGLDRFDAREQLWKDMESESLTIKVDPHTQRVPRSQRGGEVIEPLVSSQWFVKTEGMGAKALKAVEDGDIEIIPKRFDKIWNNWLTDIHDWCISRQLWWGHRIPVWYVGETGESEFIVARNEKEARSKAVENGHPEDVVLRQEEDVLDTWFSSGLWPFATVGWPANEGDANSDLARFYPGTCLETGYDIIFFWVARMVMMGIELTGESPFSVIYLHGLVRAADGSKMSKTKGNVLDPLDTVSEYGADSLRYSLVTGVTPGQDIPLNMEKIEANRNFCNKLWNSCKFVTGNALKDADKAEMEELGVTGPMSQEEFDQLLLPEKYIVSKAHALVASVTEDIEKYQLGAAGSKIYEFMWDQYADWYIEISKTRLYEGNGGGDIVEAKASRRVLVYVLDIILRVLHPYMPYVTEQLWHHLPRAKAGENQAAHALMLSDWPQMDDAAPLITNDESVTTFECFQAVTRSIRNARAEYNVEQGKKISAIVVAPEGTLKDEIERELKSLVLLARLDPDDVEVVEAGSEEAKAANNDEAIQLVVQDGVEVFLPLSGLIDPVKERARLTKQQGKLEIEIQKLAGRLGSKGFVDKAPAAVVDKAKGELAELENQAKMVQASLDALPQ
uniref:valine--tRNA ligase n=1 Tax=Pseudo-nitzschia australis TaxID=44445 RepID=A0A7S4ANC8_9STRA|mmetsp:Transcript_27555/g.60653  ORF Transcript_27555/g.60653 Transcript_27555/m.60653 type:complete len:1058 (-) Transcript_27555:87-3260(-)|eukprot:CAMPEP_0168175002 /NCGR_PEP_ID=MMETSP0139_2-20121125/6853_1 /TAXON_ID=44445 /ORGANISM="Pseudo-nitzschia australis, Strain 10249 10 AB" /LENGTH=1057 /DNA_ID=CAMNT_0008093287 /DNA_START=158 /DNA_END=3331 /DNA_ORIENTATION=+